MATFLLIIGLFLFVGLIVVHEFGHFIAARRNGVDVEEFAIFFGPSIYSRVTKAGWRFRINTIPLGGYVKLKGEHDSDTEPGSYGAASLWVKTKIMSAGVIMNVITALVILTIIGFIGLPQIFPGQFTIKSNQHQVSKPTDYVQVENVIKGSPASKSSLKSGDEILSLGTKGDMVKINNFTQLQTATEKFAGKKVTIDYQRHGADNTTAVTLNTKSYVSKQTSPQKKVYLGVELATYQSGVNLVRYTWASPIVAAGITKQVTVLTYEGLGRALSGLGGIIAGVATNNTAERVHAQTTASSQLTGPVGIFFILRAGSAIGFQYMLFIIAIISLALALMNILPLPALDGGRLWATLVTRLFKRPLSAHAEEVYNAVGMLVLLLLFVVITYVDIKRFL